MAAAGDGGQGAAAHTDAGNNASMDPSQNGNWTDASYGYYAVDPYAQQFQMWPGADYGQGYMQWPTENWDGAQWAVGSDDQGAVAGDGGAAAFDAAGNGDSKGRRGKGGGKRGGKRGSKGDGSSGGKGGQTEFMFHNGAFMGDWTDSLGHDVVVRQGPDRRGPLQATLTRGDKERILSLRRSPESGMWTCGNALLDIFSSGPRSLVWASPDGRRSVWRKEDGKEDAAPPDLLPWLLNPAFRGKAESAETEVNEEDKKEERKDPLDSGTLIDEESEHLRADGARVSILLDARQVLGGDRSSQEILSHILMDHDLVRREDEDLMVPAIDSPLWQRLPEGPRRNVLHRLSGFNASTGTECAAELADRDANIVHVGRHSFNVSSTDVQALRRRWKGPDDVPCRNALMVHVVALYRTLETPLGADWQRSSLQLGWDPVDRKRAGIEYELFASPFNASVNNGKYGSRFPHVEKWFGSAGSYPGVIDIFPESANIGVNPPFTDGYLDHVMTKTLDRIVNKFKKVHLFVPVRDAPWRPQLKRLEGAAFVREFWDSTALKSRPMGNPVMYWEGTKLADL